MATKQIQRELVFPYLPMERGILFAERLVNNVLEDRKNQTRRPISLKPGEKTITKTSDGRWFANKIGDGRKAREIKSPYGKAGDFLYVRETFALVYVNCWQGLAKTINPNDPEEACYYRAGFDRSAPRWKPSLHMPKWCSRIKLLVKDVRVEPVNSISEQDAIGEGIQPYGFYESMRRAESDRMTALAVGLRGRDRDEYAAHPYRRKFECLWDEHYGKDEKKCWSSNPFVFVADFERIK